MRVEGFLNNYKNEYIICKEVQVLKRTKIPGKRIERDGGSIIY